MCGNYKFLQSCHFSSIYRNVTFNIAATFHPPALQAIFKVLVAPKELLDTLILTILNGEFHLLYIFATLCDVLSTFEKR